MTLSKLTSVSPQPKTMRQALKARAKDLDPLIDLLNAATDGTGTGLKVASLTSDTINETTSGNGVTVDSVKLQDGMVSMLTTTLAATGTTQTNAAQIASQVVFVTDANGTAGVKLPAVAANKIIFLINTANAILKIYPATGEKIQTKASIDLAVYGVAIFGYKAAGDWYATEITAGAVG